MTAQVILNAISQGFNAKQVIQWILQNNKGLARKIQGALKQGYTEDQIAEYLTNGRYASHGQRNEMLSGMTEQEKGSRIAQGAPGDWKKPLGTALGIGTAALGGLGIARAAPAIVNALFPQPTNPSSPGPQPMSNAPVQTANINVGAPDQNAIQQASQVQAPTQSTPIPLQSNSQQNTAQEQSPQQPPSFDSLSTIQEMGLDEKINNLLSQGKTPEQVSREIVGSFNPKQRKIFTEKVRKGQIPATFEAVVRDYAAKNPEASRVRQKPVKDDFVMAPDNVVGDLADIRQKEALVRDENGKLHKVKSDEIIQSPIPSKDLADLHEDLIRGIEQETGEEVSRNVNWAGYDPKTNRLAYLPHLGALYFYDDISEEERAQLTSLLNQRKTSGENFIGAWKEGSKSPIGAAMAALIKKLQAERGGKGQEYSGKFETIYDATEPAKRAAKRKKSEEDKKRKKK